MRIEQQPGMRQSGRFLSYYRRLLAFLAVGLLILALGLMIAYRQLGGIEGARYWMAGKALDATETHALDNRPDDISEDQVKAYFQAVRQANKEREADLAKLYLILRYYQANYWQTKPSNTQTRQFLAELMTAINPRPDLDEID
jgi:hypothetical protein